MNILNSNEERKGRKYVQNMNMVKRKRLIAGVQREILWKRSTVSSYLFLLLTS